MNSGYNTLDEAKRILNNFRDNYYRNIEECRKEIKPDWDRTGLTGSYYNGIEEEDRQFIYQAIGTLGPELFSKLFDFDVANEFISPTKAVKYLFERYKLIKNDLNRLVALQEKYKSGDSIPYPIEVTLDYHQKTVDVLEVVMGLNEVESILGTLREEEAKDKLLIMKGGGIKGLAYVGAIEELEKVITFNWFAGTSAGAIAAVFMASGFTAKGLKELLEKDFSEFKDAKSLIKKIWNLLTKGGLYEAATFTNWVHTKLAKELCKKTPVLLQDLPKRVTIYACREETGPLIFDSQDPACFKERAADVVRCSMSIPFIFTPMKDKELSIFDGGAQNNYPVKILLEHNPGADFIGLYLGPPTYEGRKKKSIIGKLLSIWMESIDYESLEAYGDQTIVVDPRPISTLQFKLNEKEKEFLLESGRLEAKRFLSAQKYVTENHFREIELTQQSRKVEELREELYNKLRLRKRRKNVTVLTIIFLIACSIFLYQKLTDWRKEQLFLNRMNLTTWIIDSSGEEHSVDRESVLSSWDTTGRRLKLEFYFDPIHRKNKVFQFRFDSVFYDELGEEKLGLTKGFKWQIRDSSEFDTPLYFRNILSDTLVFSVDFEINN